MVFFNNGKEPKLVSKPFESLLSKALRRDVLENQLFPQEPTGGWLMPDKWNSRVNDIVRTYFVTKYLDGAGFMVKKIHGLCEKDRKGLKVSNKYISNKLDNI